MLRAGHTIRMGIRADHLLLRRYAGGVAVCGPRARTPDGIRRRQSRGGSPWRSTGRPGRRGTLGMAHERPETAARPRSSSTRLQPASIGGTITRSAATPGFSSTWTTSSNSRARCEVSGSTDGEAAPGTTGEPPRIRIVRRLETTRAGDDRIEDEGVGSGAVSSMATDPISGSGISAAAAITSEAWPRGQRAVPGAILERILLPAPVDDRRFLERSPHCPGTRARPLRST